MAAPTCCIGSRVDPGIVMPMTLDTLRAPPIVLGAIGGADRGLELIN